MSIAKIQTGDTVKVIAGNYKGLIGQVIKVVKVNAKYGNKVNTRVAVSTVPKISKFRKAQTHQGQEYPGSITAVDRLIDISNVASWNGTTTSRVRIAVIDGKKVRTTLNGDVINKVRLEKVAPTTSTEEALSN
jgi:ribosomal protein L24